jgi:hypothetical protein
MSLSIVVNGGGTFTASMEEGPVSFTASLAAVGPKGDTGPGVAVGGTTGQVLAKASATNYDTEWVARNPFNQELNTTDTVNFGEVRIPSPDNHAKLSYLMWRPFSNAYGDLGVEYLGDKVVFADDTEQTTALPSGLDDGYIVEWNADTNTYVSVPNDARTLFIIARNITGTTIPKGSVVLITGASGNRPTIGLAQGDTAANADGVIGITAVDIANNAIGRVITEGLANNLNTDAFAAGDKLYLSAVTPGGLVNVRPVQPAHSVAVGVVTRSNSSIGSIEVRVQVGEHLEFLHDVLLTSNTNLDLLSYETSSGLWKNKSFSTLGLLTSATAASTYLTTSTAASTYAPLASPTFTGTVTIPAGASISGFALLASPVFTGVPEAPTAAATTNTTQVATTAFVQQEVPAASTSAAGKVELATDAEAVAGTSATLAVTPSGSLNGNLSSSYHRFYGADFSAATSGTGGLNDSFNSGAARRTFGPTSVGAGHVAALHGIPPFSGQTVNANLNWSRRVVVAARIVRSSISPSSESIFRVTIGEVQNSNTGDPAVAAIGIKVVGSGAMEILAHDGTSLTTFSTSHTPSVNQAFDLILVSDGAGNVEAFVNGSSVGSTTGGPTTLLAGTATNRNFYAKVENTSSFTSGPNQYYTYTPAVAVL